MTVVLVCAKVADSAMRAGVAVLAWCNTARVISMAWLTETSASLGGLNDLSSYRHVLGHRAIHTHHRMGTGLGPLRSWLQRKGTTVAREIATRLSCRIRETDSLRKNCLL